MSKCNFVAIDFETATTNRFPCQMGIVVVRGGEIAEKKEYLIKPPGNKYSPSCIRVHGITPEHTKGCKEFPALWDEIKEYLRLELVVAHNISFDFDVLDRVIEYYNLDEVQILSGVCTCELYNNRKLSDVTAALGIELANEHNALCDAEMSAKIFLAYLLDGVDPYRLAYPEREVSSRSATYPKNDPNRKLSSDVKQQDLNIVENKDNYFYDKKVVISGVFDRFPVRQELALLLKKYGADINTSISRKTDIFIVGNDFGPSKMSKVISLKEAGCDIEILETSQLYAILGDVSLVNSPVSKPTNRTVERSLTFEQKPAYIVEKTLGLVFYIQFLIELSSGTLEVVRNLNVGDDLELSILDKDTVRVLTSDGLEIGYVESRSAGRVLNIIKTSSRFYCGVSGKSRHDIPVIHASIYY